MVEYDKNEELIDLNNYVQLDYVVVIHKQQLLIVIFNLILLDFCLYFHKLLANFLMMQYKI